MYDDLNSIDDTTHTRERLMQLLGQYTVQIEDLKAENSALKEKLMIRDGEPKPDIDKGAEDRYNKLREAHDALRNEHARCDVVIAKALRKYQTARESVQQWRAYIDKRHRRQQDRAERLDNPPMLSTINGPSTPRSCSSESVQVGISEQHGLLPEAVISAQPAATVRDHENDEDSAQREAREEEETIIGQHCHVPQHTSSQTTETDGGEIEHNVKREPSSDDEPIVVAERVLKRKRNDTNPQQTSAYRIKQEPGSPNQPVTVLSDDFHDSTTSAIHLERCETSDLDMTVEPIGTPRLRRTRDWPSSRAISENRVHGSTLPSMHRVTRRWSSLSDSELPNTSDGLLNGRVPLQETRDVLDLRPVISGSKSKLQSRSGRALRPISVNVPRPSSDSVVGRGPSKQRKFSETQDKIMLVSEDGDMLVGRKSPAQASVAKHVEPETKQRLDAILERPPPDKLPLSRERARDMMPSALQSMDNVTGQEDNISNPVSRKKTSETPSRLNVARQSIPSAKTMPSKKTPLRSRPPEMLKLDDFQINPNYLGTNFAFTDPIRGKEQRKCLQACTRPDCCGGQYRKLIEIAGKQITARSDSQALEEYLGPQYEAIVASYDSRKRNDLVMQAHAYSFANQHGSHRQAFQRESTPPGFWRTEMPSTQEMEEDRWKAEGIERQKIEERWREAMRSGARWIFRDEMEQGKGRAPYKSL